MGKCSRGVFVVSLDKDKFSLPDGSDIYINNVIERCENLIAYGIWSGIELTRLRKWLCNFDDGEEKYFAACILDSLIYRSEGQTFALIQQLFQRILPDLNRSDPMPISPAVDWKKSLKKSNQDCDPGIRLVVAVKSSDPPTKSAHAVARYMKRSFSINERWIIKPTEMENQINYGIKVFLFIDDFLGTGNQFSTFIKDEGLSQCLSSIYAAYIPLTAHKDGIKNLRYKFNNLRVTAVEILDETHNLFHESCNCFKDGKNNHISARMFYDNLLKVKNIKIKPVRQDFFGNLELAYIFSHAAPNNCLPILWWKETPTWHPLFDR